MALTPGVRLGPYEVLSAIGAGGMGEVYRARDTRLGREVAVKVLPPDLATDESRLRRFEAEARAVSALNHPQHPHHLRRRPRARDRVPCHGVGFRSHPETAAPRWPVDCAGSCRSGHANRRGTCCRP